MIRFSKKSHSKVLGGREGAMVEGAIYKCMEAMLGFSLYSYHYLKLAKTQCLSYYLLCFLVNKIGEEEGGTGSSQNRGMGEGVPNNVYTCK
jgi:hypothetical protein